MTWRLAGEFRMHGWDGQIVAYDPRSGDTHCFDHVASAVLGRIAAAASTDAQLCDGLAPILGGTAEARADEIRLALEELERLRLVQRA